MIFMEFMDNIYDQPTLVNPIFPIIPIFLVGLTGIALISDRVKKQNKNNVLRLIKGRS